MIKYDITGQVFGNLTAIAYEKEHDYKWKCRCSCGNIVYSLSTTLRKGLHTSCGCTRYGKTNKKLIDLTGKQFERLTVLEYSFDKRKWKCQCSCGNTHYVESGALRGGQTRSCGCFKVDIAKTHMTKIATTHGLSGTPEYKTWLGMRQRCSYPGNASYPSYGGKGVRVCDRWQTSFEAFINDVGKKPSPKHSIDRIDNNGNYEPGNVKWATRKEQSRNKRNTRLFTHNGKSMILRDWAIELGINYSTLAQRIYACGWSVDRTLSTPVHRRKKPHS